jgi:phage terminase small subunit
MEIDRQRVLEGLLEAVEMARIQQDPGAMIRAWAEIGRMCGFFAPERAVKVDVNITAKRVIQDLETRSDEELLEFVARQCVTSGPT